MCSGSAVFTKASNAGFGRGIKHSLRTAAVTAVLWAPSRCRSYTGSGLKFNGVPMVQLPGTGTLVLSGDPACKTPDGDKFTFPPVNLSRERLGPCCCWIADVALLLRHGAASWLSCSQWVCIAGSLPSKCGSCSVAIRIPRRDVLAACRCLQPLPSLALP